MALRQAHKPRNVRGHDNAFTESNALGERRFVWFVRRLGEIFGGEIDHVDRFVYKFQR